jgi:hypothetical protein
LIVAEVGTLKAEIMGCIVDSIIAFRRARWST